MIGFPFDSQVTYDEYGTPIFDRAISSLPLRTLINKLFSDGVLPNPSTNFQVVANENMTVKVKAGFAICKGCMKLEETDRVIEFEAADTNDRIDTVVLRLNDSNDVRMLDLYVHKGTPSTSPVRPELTRIGSIYEIGLADVFIPKNTSVIAASRITDTRYETARCGVISSISQFDTTTLYNQVQADLTEFKTEEQAQWLEWFNNLVYVLDGDVAGHLQNEIDATNTKIGSTPIPATLGDSITGAIVSLNDTLNEKLFQIKNSYTTSNGYVTIRDNRIKSDSIIVSVEQYGDISKLHSLIVSESSHSNGELNITLMTYQGSGYSGSVNLKCVIAN